MPAAATSYRLSPALKQRLAARARHENTTETALVTRLLDIGLKTADYAGIVYRNGPSGWRAALSDGPDVWEVVLGLRSADGRGQAKVIDAADQMSLTERQVRLAIDFAAAYPDEIDERIAANDAEAERVRRIVEARDRLFDS